MYMHKCTQFVAWYTPNISYCLLTGCNKGKEATATGADVGGSKAGSIASLSETHYN